MLSPSLQKYIIFRPVGLSTSYSYDFDATFEELFLQTLDGEHINALHFTTTATIRKGIILYFHGNADNLKRWGKLHQDFLPLGYDFFIMDYRSYGKSTGEVSEMNMYKDAQLVYNYVRKRYPYDKIVIYGRSLGSAVASHIASQNPARQLILETPFDNMYNLFRTHTRNLFPLPSELVYKFPNDYHIRQVKYPIYIYQGTHDRVVPYQVAERLKPHLKASDEFIRIDQGNHRNLNTFPLYRHHLTEILDSGQ